MTTVEIIGGTIALSGLIGLAVYLIVTGKKLKRHQQEIIDNVRARGSRTVMTVGKGAGKTNPVPREDTLNGK